MLLLTELPGGQDQTPDHQQENDRHQEITPGGEVHDRLSGKVCPEHGLKRAKRFMDRMRSCRVDEGFRQGEARQNKAEQ